MAWDNPSMKWWVIVVAAALLLASCGKSYSGEFGASDGVPADLSETALGAACRTFISETVSLHGETDIEVYRRTLQDTIAPVVQLAYEAGMPIDANQDLSFALERMYAGDTAADDLWAVSALGEIIGESTPGCDGLGRHFVVNVKSPPPHFDQAPTVEVTSPYETGTEDYACDTFIRTINVWEREASVGAEYGPSMASAVETLIEGLEALGIDTATDSLEQVADLWASKPWVQANEEGGEPLMAAARALTEVGTGRCSELFDAVNPPSTVPAEPVEQPQPVNVDVAAVEIFEPEMACGRIRVSGGTPIPEPRPLDADALAALDALEAVGGEGAAFTDGYNYGIFSRTADRLFLIGTAENGSHSDVEFERAGGAWKPAGWGTCEWRAADYREVAWQLQREPNMEFGDDVIDLIAVDNCGSVARDGYEVVVVAEYSDDAVRLSVWESLYPPEFGNSSDSFGVCSIGGLVDVHVELPQPLESRTIRGEFAELTELEL